MASCALGLIPLHLFGAMLYTKSQVASHLSARRSFAVSQNKSTATRILVAVGVLSAIAFLGALEASWRSLSLATKAIPVLCMLVWVVRVGVPSSYRAWIIPGLGFSALGDILLEIPANLFLYGLLSFLIAHLCYIAAYLSRRKALDVLHAWPFWGYGVAMFVFLLYYGKMGALMIPVGVYTFVICSMLWRASSLYRADLPRGTVHAAFWGALLFALSDSTIALNKFHAPVPGARYIIMLLYWIGQTGIAASVQGVSDQSPESAPV